MAQPKSKSVKKTRRKKKSGKRKGGDAAKSEPTPAAPRRSTPKKAAASSGGGGVMQSIRSGFQRAAGAGEPVDEKPSTASNVIWTVVLLAAVAFLLYRWYG